MTSAGSMARLGTPRLLATVVGLSATAAGSTAFGIWRGAAIQAWPPGRGPLWADESTPHYRIAGSESLLPPPVPAVGGPGRVSRAARPMTNLPERPGAARWPKVLSAAVQAAAICGGLLVGVAVTVAR